MARILAFDYGRARIGVSISDERKLIASSLFVLHWKKSLKETLKELECKIQSWKPIELFVIGFPLLMNGKEGEMALEAKSFAKALEDHFSIPFQLWDERLSTAQAERLMKEGNLSRKQRSDKIDAMCSTLILQNYLDCHGLTKTL